MPLGIPVTRMSEISRSDSTSAASSSPAPRVSAPSQPAASRWRFGQAEAVKRNTEGALTMTDMPWGTIGPLSG